MKHPSHKLKGKLLVNFFIKLIFLIRGTKKIKTSVLVIIFLIQLLKNDERAI